MPERVNDSNRLSDIVTFLQSWTSAPLRVGAIAQSGAALGDLITRGISSSTGRVMELGPGTGVFTAKLLERGVLPENLTLIECGSEFVERLQTRFPGVQIINMDAARLRRLLFDEPAGAVVSGLPLLNIPSRKVIEILDGAFAHLRPGGAFYQFTYALRCPVPRPILDRLGLRATIIGKTLQNLPPASVYRISRRPPWRSVQNLDAVEPHTGI